MGKMHSFPSVHPVDIDITRDKIPVGPQTFSHCLCALLAIKTGGGNSL